MNNLLRVILTFFVLSFTVSHAVEKPIVGVISAAVGEIYNQNNKKLKSGDKIYFGDSIIVKDKSNSQILLLDETVMSVGSNSEIKIDEFIYDPKTKDGKILSQIKSGSMKVLTGGVSEKNPANLEIKVPAGTIGTRGTEFQATVDATNSESKILLIGPGPDNSLGLRPGAVEVENNFGKVLLDKPFLFTQMSATTAPQAPIPVPQNELKQFQQRLETKAAPATAQIATAQKETTEKALFSGDLKKENIIQQIIKNPNVIASLDKQLGTTGAIQISSIVNEQGIINSQVAINELSKMVDKGTITSQDFFSLVGKDEKGNLIVTNGKPDTTVVTTANSTANTINKETTTGVPATTLNTSGLTGTYSYTASNVEFSRSSIFYNQSAKPVTSQVFKDVAGYGVSNYYNTTSLVDFTNKTIKTNYNGSLTWYTPGALVGDIAPPTGTATTNTYSITSTGTTFTGTPTEQFNFKLNKTTGASNDANLANITTLPLSSAAPSSTLSAYTGTNGDVTSNQSTNQSTAAAFGNFNNGVSTFTIERYNCYSGAECTASSAYGKEKLTGNTTITTATPTKQ